MIMEKRCFRQMTVWTIAASLMLAACSTDEGYTQYYILLWEILQREIKNIS